MAASACLADALDHLAAVLSRLAGPNRGGWVAIAGMDGRIVGFPASAHADPTLWGAGKRIVGDPTAAELVRELRRAARAARRGMPRASLVFAVLRRVEALSDDEHVRVALTGVYTRLRDDGAALEEVRLPVLSPRWRIWRIAYWLTRSRGMSDAGDTEVA